MSDFQFTIHIDRRDSEIYASFNTFESHSLSEDLAVRLIETFLLNYRNWEDLFNEDK